MFPPIARTEFEEQSAAIREIALPTPTLQFAPRYGDRIGCGRNDKIGPAERAVTARVKELFRSADGMALALSGAPPEKIEHDIMTLPRILEVNFAKHQDWPSSEFVEGFIAASGALAGKEFLEDDRDQGNR